MSKKKNKHLMSVTTFENEEPREQTFVEFVSVRRMGSFYPEAIILYESQTRGNVTSVWLTPIDLSFQIHLFTRIAEFTVQVGYMIEEKNVQRGRRFAVVTTSGDIIVIERKKRGKKSYLWLTPSHY